MISYTKPLPRLDDHNRLFWKGARTHKVCLQSCLDCGAHRFPAARACSKCGSARSEWVAVSGRGIVDSFCVFHKQYFPGFEGDMPYNVAVVILEEGVKLFTNIVGVPNDEIRINMEVEPYFDDVTPEVTLLKFQPAGQRDSS